MSRFQTLQRPLFADSAGKISENNVCFRGAPGETACFSFGIRSDDTVGAVTLMPTKFMSSGNTTCEAEVDLRFIAPWQQAGIGVYQSAPVMVHELLLKEENLPTHGDYRYCCGNPLHLHHLANYLKGTPWFYHPPQLRHTGSVIVSIAAGENKWFWGSVRIPANTTSGTYESSIQLFDHAGCSLGSIILTLEVLPFTLIEPPQDRMLWYKGTLDCARSRFYVSEKQFRFHLQDIFDHGFSSISLYETKPNLLRRALKIAAEIGFKRNVVLSAPFFAGNVNVRAYGLQPIYYVSDEPDIRGNGAIAPHQRNWKLARAKGVPSFTSLTNYAFTKRFKDKNDVGCPPDILSLYLSANCELFHLHSAFKGSRQKGLYYYWHAHMEKPNLHRVLAGAYLWKSSAEGISPYCYQHPPVRPFDPFNDFDDWDPNFHVGSERRSFKDHMATYPSAFGSIPTLQWKGMAEGIRDLKYLATLDVVLHEAGSSNTLPLLRLAREIREELEEFFARIDLRTVEIDSETNANPYTHLHAGEYDMFREKVTQGILSLKHLLSR